MAKSKTGFTAKEETLNLIVEAQADKIVALTDYGKKLKKDLKQCKENNVVICQDIEQGYKDEIERIESINQKVLVMAVVGSILFGLAIGIIL